MKYNELFIRHNKISLSVKLDKIEVINPVSKSKKIIMAKKRIIFNWL